MLHKQRQLLSREYWPLEAAFIYLWVPGQAGGVELLDVRDGLIQCVVPGLHPIDVGLVSEDINKKEIFIYFRYFSFCGIKFVYELYKPGSYYLILLPYPPDLP